MGNFQHIAVKTNNQKLKKKNRSNQLNISIMKDCCIKNIDKAKRVGRCHYICPVCDEDVSLAWILFQEEINYDKEDS